jgi:hypothetical protein
MKRAWGAMVVLLLLASCSTMDVTEATRDTVSIVYGKPAGGRQRASIDAVAARAQELCGEYGRHAVLISDEMDAQETESAGANRRRAIFDCVE